MNDDDSNSKKAHMKEEMSSTPSTDYYKRGKQGAITKALTKDKLEELYIVQNKSLEDIAKEYSCTRQMVMFIMQKHGIERRNRSKARVTAVKRGKFERCTFNDYKEDFFSTWSPGMAWVLGLIFTDGNLSQGQKGGFRVSLTSVDLELLEKVCKIIGSSKAPQRILQSYDKTKHIYKIEFYRESMIKDLQKLGLTPKKSLTMKFPDVPEEHMRHFIRGCWDGDGSVYLCTKRSKQLSSYSKIDLHRKQAAMKNEMKKRRGKLVDAQEDLNITFQDGKQITVQTEHPEECDLELNASYVSGSKDFIEKLVHELYKIGIGRTVLQNSSGKIEDRIKMKQGYPDGFFPLAIHPDRRSKAFSIKVRTKNELEKLFHYFYDGLDEPTYLTRKYETFIKWMRAIPIIRDKKRDKPLIKRLEKGEDE